MVSSQKETFSLFQLVKKSITLDSTRKKELIEAKEKGSAFFQDFNDSRMKLAFSVFSDEMRKALFEVIYFLHVNDPRYKEFKYTATRKERVHSILREVPYEEVADLYTEGSPSGVVGISSISPIFQEDFENYITKEFNDRLTENSGFTPIYSIASLGSIGTIGHKKFKSDLDLQVQYELEPFLYYDKDFSDQKIRTYTQRLAQLYSKRYIRIKKYSSQDLQDPEIKKEVILAGRKSVYAKFPIIFQFAFKGLKSFDMSSKQIKQGIVHQFIDFYKFCNQNFFKAEKEAQEKLLKEKILKVQDYVQKKFPHAEIYLFAYSNDAYRAGKHGTTLESKESSGSAYELILNYDVLMPGIQFSPMIPIHFLMPETANSSTAFYDRIVDYTRFGLVDIYDQYRELFVNLGATPPLSMEYMTAHAGAVYWESFKASSGNLPKALLNLLRIEMLFDQKFSGTVIEIIKNPTKMDHFLGELPEDDEDDIGLHDEIHDSFPLWGLKQLELDFPILLQDPWWIRYKLLKIGFSSHNERVDSNELLLLSKIIDLCFALHISISIVFIKPGEKKQFTTHREKVLAKMWDEAFPPMSAQREFLEHVFIGEVKSINTFEQQMKMLFKNSLKRVNQIVEDQPFKDKSNRDEFKIWYSYYETNFEPAPTVVQRSILTHLKVPRGKLEIGHRDGFWYFKANQKMSSVGKRFDTFGTMSHLPDEVELFDHESFLHGITHCILNGYYGVLNKGTLKETKTAIEFKVGSMDLGSKVDNEYAYVRPDNVIRIVDNINAAFPYQEYDYRDVLKAENKIVNVYIFVNLLTYGSVSILYRDSLRNWHVDLFEHPQVGKRATEFYKERKRIMIAIPLHQTIRKFLKEKNFELNEENLKNVTCWFNPNSVQTHHGSQQLIQKENDLGEEFKQYFIQVQRHLELKEKES
ncbi:MAG: hypothetical protein ACI86H_002970 [bacterium]|jgi:hypothetical protein